MESKVFTAELDEKLIDMVRDHPVLYSFTHKNYKNNAIKENVWNLISVALAINIDECKMRWITIRDSYKKNLNKIKANSTTGSPAFPKSKYLNKNLQFLDDTYKGKKVTSSFQSPAPIASAAEDGSRPCTSHSERAEKGADETAEEDLLEFSERTDDISDFEINEPNATNDEPEKKKKRFSAKEKMIQEIRSGREERNVILKELFSEKKIQSAPVFVVEHPIDIFLRACHKS